MRSALRRQRRQRKRLLVSAKSKKGTAILMKKVLARIPFKRILYTLCFLAINLIEFMKATHDGDVWYVAVNLTGLAVFCMIASTFSCRDFFNWWNGAVTVVMAAVMAFLYYYKHAYPAHYFHLGQVETAMLNVWWILIVGKVLFRRIFLERTQKVRLNPLAGVWILLMVLMIFSINDRVWPLWFLVMFGFFYLTPFSPAETKALLDGMLDGTILSFFGFQIFAYATRPYDVVRYVGFYNNSNTVALYYLMVYGMVLCKLHILHMKKANVWWKLFYFIGAGGLLSFQIFTLCRTAWVTSIVLTIVYGGVVLHGIWEEKWSRVILRGAALTFMMAATFLPVFLTIRWLPTLTHYRVWLDGEYSVDKVHSFDPPDSEKYIELDEFLDEFLGRVINTLTKTEAINPFVLHARAEEENAFEENAFEENAFEENAFEEDPIIPQSDTMEKSDNTGMFEQKELLEVPWTNDMSTRIRLTIYKAYLEDMTWYGNPSNKGYYQIGEDAVSWHAQNLWIQIGYSFGIPAGILLIVLTVMLGLNDRKVIRLNPTDPYSILPMMVGIIFFVFGLTEVVWLPGQLILFLMFFVHHPQFASAQEKTQEDRTVSGKLQDAKKALGNGDING